MKEKNRILNFQLLKNATPVRVMDQNQGTHLIDAQFVVEMEK